MAEAGRTAKGLLFQVLNENGRVVREVAFEGRVKVGRSSPESTPEVVIPAEHRSASRHHAVIEYAGGKTLLTDRSRLGTLVNGVAIHNATVELKHGDELVFGLPEDGWRVRFQKAGNSVETTSAVDPLELLVVSDSPRQVRLGRTIVEEHLGDRAFRLLKFLVDNRGNWYPIEQLEGVLWPDADNSPYQTAQALSRSKRAINLLLAPHLRGQDAIESWPHRGYRLKARLDSA